MGPTGGDTIWIGAGTYREVLTANLTSPTSELRIVADIDGANTGDPGEVILTGWTTSDTAAASGSANINVNSKNYLTFEGLTLVGNGVNSLIQSLGHHCTLRACTLISLAANSQITGTTVAGTPWVFTMERCVCYTAATSSNIWLSLSLARHTAEVDNASVIRNCVFIGGSTLAQIQSTGAGAFFSGGITFDACTVANQSGTYINLPSSTLSALYPVTIINNLVLGSGGLYAEGSPGQIVSEANRFLSTSALTDLPQFSASGVVNAVYPEVGQSALLGLVPRPFLAPTTALAPLNAAPVALAVQRAATLSDDATVGTITWTNPTNAAAPNDGSSATASTVPATTGITHYLKAVGGFAVPAGATIKGVRVDVSAASSAGTVACSSVKLVKAGTISGNEGAAFNTGTFSSGQTRRVYGSTSDPLWGLTLTDTDVNDAGFGAVFAFKNTGGASSNITCEYLRLIVSYTLDGDAQIMSVDLLNRPRPSGSNQVYGTVGALERHDFGAKETSVTHGGSAALKLTGPGDHQFDVPVDASATTITAYMRYDTTHGTGTKPQMSILDSPDIGVTTSTATMTASADTWEQLTIGPFTPTAKGIVTIRFRNRAAAAGGLAYVDDVTVA